MLALALVIQQFAEAVRRGVVQLRRANVNVCNCTMRHFDEDVTVNMATSAQSATDCAYRKCEQGWCLAQHRRSPKRHGTPCQYMTATDCDSSGCRGWVKFTLSDIECRKNSMSQVRNFSQSFKLP